MYVLFVLQFLSPVFFSIFLLGVSGVYGVVFRSSCSCWYGWAACTNTHVLGVKCTSGFRHLYHLFIFLILIQDQTGVYYRLLLVRPRGKLCSLSSALLSLVEATEKLTLAAHLFRRSSSPLQSLCPSLVPHLLCLLFPRTRHIFVI